MGPLLGRLLGEIAKKQGKALVKKGQALTKSGTKKGEYIKGKPRAERGVGESRVVDVDYSLGDLAPYGSAALAGTGIGTAAAGLGALLGRGALPGGPGSGALPGNAGLGALPGSIGGGGRVIPPLPPGAFELEDGAPIDLPSITVTPESGLGDALAGSLETLQEPESESVQAPSPARPLANSAHQNASFFSRPDVRAGMIQMGLALMSGANMGQAGSAGVSAAGRYNQQQQQRSQQQQEMHQQKMRDMQAMRESESLIKQRESQMKLNQAELQNLHKNMQTAGISSQNLIDEDQKNMELINNSLDSADMPTQVKWQAARLMTLKGFNLITPQEFSEKYEALINPPAQAPEEPVRFDPASATITPMSMGPIGDTANASDEEVAGLANKLGTDSVSLLDTVKNLMAGAVGPANPDMMMEGPVEIPSLQQQQQPAVPQPNFYDPATMSGQLPESHQPAFDAGVEPDPGTPAMLDPVVAPQAQEPFIAQSARRFADSWNQTMQALKGYEGLRLEEYKDHLGHPTIGYGFKLSNLTPQLIKRYFPPGWKRGMPITTDTAEKLLQHQAAENVRLYERATGLKLDDFPPVVQSVLMNMAYQLGGDGANFPEMVKALKRGDFKLAAQHGRDSKWWREDTPQRAEHLMSILETA